MEERKVQQQEEKERVWRCQEFQWDCL